MPDSTNEPIEINTSGEIIITQPGIGQLTTLPGYWIDDVPDTQNERNLLRIRTGRVYRVYPDPDDVPEPIPLPEPNPYKEYPKRYTQGEMPWSCASLFLRFGHAAWSKPSQETNDWTPIDNPNDASIDSLTDHTGAQTFYQGCFLPAGESQWYTRRVEIDVLRTQETRRDLFINGYRSGARIAESVIVGDAAFAELKAQIERSKAIPILAPVVYSHRGQTAAYGFHDPSISPNQASDTLQIVRVDIRFAETPAPPGTAPGHEYDIAVPETIAIETNIWRRDKDIVFRIGSQVFALESFPRRNVHLTTEQRSAIWDALNERNQSAGLADPIPDAPPKAVRTWQTHDLEANFDPADSSFYEILGFEIPPFLLPYVEPDNTPPGTRYKRKKGDMIERKPALPTTLVFQTDRIGMLTMRALSAADTWTALPTSQFYKGFRHNYGQDFSATVGLPQTTQAAALWKTISASGHKAVKAHFALWGMWYQAQEAGGTEAVRVSINQFCEWMGYEKHHKGGYKFERKQEARAVLDALTQIEVLGSYSPGKGKPVQRLRGGKLWDAVLHESTYGDLFGQAGEWDPQQWEPLSFAFRPGMAQLDQDFRRQNHYIGRVASSLLKIPNTEEWALLIGGYLAFQDRANGYQPFKRRISTILAAISRGQNMDRRVRQKTEARFWRSLDVLKQFGVIADYERPSDNAAHEDIQDFDDAAEIAAYFDEEPAARADWRAKCVLFTMPHITAGNILKAQTQQAIENSAKQQRKRGRPRKEPAE